MKKIKDAFGKITGDKGDKGDKGRHKNRNDGTSRVTNVIDRRENLAAAGATGILPLDQSRQHYDRLQEARDASYIRDARNARGTANTWETGAASYENSGHGYGRDYTQNMGEGGFASFTGNIGSGNAYEQGEEIAGPSNYQSNIQYPAERYTGKNDSHNSAGSHADLTQQEPETANSDVYWENFPHPDQSYVGAAAEVPSFPNANEAAALQPAQGGYVEAHSQQGWPNQGHALDLRPLQESLGEIQETATARELREARERTDKNRALEEYRTTRSEYKRQTRDAFKNLKAKYYSDVDALNPGNYNSWKEYQNAVTARHDTFKWDEVPRLFNEMRHKLEQLNQTVGRDARDSEDYVLSAQSGMSNIVPSRPTFRRDGRIDRY